MFDFELESTANSSNSLNTTNNSNTLSFSVLLLNKHLMHLERALTYKPPSPPPLLSLASIQKAASDHLI